MSTSMPVVHAANGLQDFIAISRYARYSPEKRRRESWGEAVARVRDMHLVHYSDRSLGDGALAAVEDREVLPSMRSLQFGGDAILTKHARIYNCCFTYVDRIETFRETLY